jgi:hypothetical protein
MRIARLEDETQEPAKRLASDIDLFGEEGVVPSRLGKAYVATLCKSA